MSNVDRMSNFIWALSEELLQAWNLLTDTKRHSYKIAELRQRICRELHVKWHHVWWSGMLCGWSTAIEELIPNRAVTYLKHTKITTINTFYAHTDTLTLQSNCTIIPTILHHMRSLHVVFVSCIIHVHIHMYMYMYIHVHVHVHLIYIHVRSCIAFT